MMRCCGGVLLAVLLMTSAGAALGAETPQAPTLAGPSASRAAMAEYQRKLAEYTQARAKFDEAAGPYWSAVAEKRRGRNAKRRDGR
jgi:hypothetical protein